MTTSFFGGDPNMAHFSAHVSYKHYGMHGKERREAYAKVKEHFAGRQKYFQFRTNVRNTAMLKANAKKRCEAYAAEITEKTGVVMEVSEGFFL